MYIPLGGATADSTMTCASCHDVHNKEVAANQRFFLVQTNKDSALCLVCHNK
jgi:predicted CXXCH cytochrome family protein